MTTELPIPTPNGFDSVIAARNPQWVSFLPEGLEIALLGSGAAVVDGERWAIDSAEALLKITAVMRLLVRQSVAMAGLPPVRTAWFTVTTDTAIVRKYGEAHDCATCRAGTDQAIARLRERPDDPLVVGILAF